MARERVGTRGAQRDEGEPDRLLARSPIAGQIPLGRLGPSVGTRRVHVQHLRAAGNRALGLVLSEATSTKSVQRADLHGGATVPDTAGQQAITGAMHPGATTSRSGTVTVRTWGGLVPGGIGPPSPAQQRVRDRTMAALRRAIRAELNRELVSLRPLAARYAAHRVTPADIEGAGNAAADVVRSHVGEHIKHSVGGGPRFIHGFTAGANLLDAYDPADRATAGEPISAEAVVQWAAFNSPAASVRRRFAFDPGGAQENAWLTSVAVPAIIGSRRADFELWDRFGFALVGRIGNRTLATTVPTSGHSTAVPAAGGLSPAQRAARWSAFEELMHEFFHLVEHPAHVRARNHSAMGSALHEGVTDVLTEDTYNAKQASVRRDPAIIAKVEGTAPASGAIVPTRFLPTRYTIAYPDEVAEVRASLGSVGLDGFKAAYLMGHVEYEGLEPSGADRPPVAPGTGQGIELPVAITTMAQLVRATGVSETAIRTRNGLAPASPLPRRLNIPGWREHIVVATPSGTTETVAEIARQHDVSVADLDANNTHVAGWPALRAGMKVLVPPRGFRP